LRIGYLVLPPSLRGRLRDTEHHTTWYVSPLSTALASRWMEDGTAWRRLLAQRGELAARHRLCARHLGRFDWRGTPHCPHVWLAAPPGGSDQFAKRALAKGVVVVPASVFAAGRSVSEDGIRISIGAATDRGSLAEGLSRLARLA
jgi:DNA-binding transcriptional MocR family regulator